MLDAKRHLMLGISHELRSPLSRLRLALEFLDDGNTKEDLRAEIVEMEQIISTLLEAERLNTRHAPLNRTPVLVRDLIEQLITDYFDRDRERIELLIDDDSVLANVDDARLMLLIKNILSNALRYSPPESGPVVIRAWIEKGELCITLSDHGPGFSPEQIAHFAEPFYRGDPSRTRQTGGTGLGLYISRLIAEAHGGSLCVDISYLEGARLIVRLPVT
jgi:signal transduction histidine kinase